MEIEMSTAVSPVVSTVVSDLEPTSGSQTEPKVDPRLDPLHNIDTTIRGGTTQPIIMTGDMERAMSHRYAKNNRKLREAKVKAMARRILLRKWADNGTARIFDNQGNCLNSHHTHAAHLLALETDPTVTMPVNLVWGVDPAAISTIDTAINRTPSDHVKFLGFEFHDDAAVAMATRYVNRILDPTTAPPKGRGVNALTAKALELDEMENVIYDHSEQFKAADAFVDSLKCDSVTKGVTFVPAMLITLHLLANGDPKVQEFITQVATGDNVAATSPAKALRTVLGKKGKKRDSSQLMALAMFLYKQHSQGVLIDKLGPYPKTYPTL